MKKIATIILALVITTLVIAQEENTEPRPVRKTFNGSLLIDNQTIMTPNKGTFEMLIHHRFGRVEKLSDLFGIYAPSNIRLGLNYGITPKLMVGVGTEKNNKLQELHWKYAILQQKKNGLPFSVSYYGAINLAAGPIEAYGQNAQFTNRLSYFNQFIAARKFSNDFSVQLAGEFAHFNAVDSVWQHDVSGVSVGAKYDFYNNMTFLVEYDQPLSVKTVRYYQNRLKPNLAFGLEVNTSTHNFQIFAANYSHIMSAKNLVFNTNDLAETNFILGFNITVRF